MSMSVPPGQVTCLVGDNGAGKSTLVKIISGLQEPDTGEIWLGDRRLEHFTPQAARDAGIATVHQNLQLCDNLDAVANVTLGAERVRGRGPFALLDNARARRDAVDLLNDVGGHIRDLKAPVRSLSGGQRQAIAIARALSAATRLIILDEPTAALGVKQTAATLDLVRRVADVGLPVVMISHSLDDVFAVADRVVALRLGEISLDTEKSRTDRSEVVSCMTGLLVGTSPETRHQP
ncbi:ATP-binding cassette domain-containing protein [Kribbella sp. NPDC050124]|uniref:ATP-binding cassette domain-containing protein n=1 Tax=Kribbella sp. NPDC050124 TaxID=3364114 RepID=UPI0037896AF5